MKSLTKSLMWIAAIVAVSISCATLITACSSDEVQPSSNLAGTDAYALLIGELADYACKFSSNHPTQSRDDHGWNKFKKALKADHVGYSNGCWVGSIGESRKKWKELKREETLAGIENNGLSTEQRRELKQQVDSLVQVFNADDTNIGAIHNAAILQSFLNDDLDFETTGQLVVSTIASIQSLGIDVSGISTQDVVEEIDDFFETIYDDDVTTMYDRLAIKYPERKEELTIQCQYLTTIEGLVSLKDMVKFTEGYVAIIKKADLPPLPKKRLISNISIGPSSYNLWETIDANSN